MSKRKIIITIGLVIALLFLGFSDWKQSLPDGTYTIHIQLEGGTGKASVQSPSTMRVKDNEKLVRIEWSSPYYDYMIVDGIKYLNENESGNSVFTIPVNDLNSSLTVIADTTAMSVPHEIEYTLTFEVEK